MLRSNADDRPLTSLETAVPALDDNEEDSPGMVGKFFFTLFYLLFLSVSVIVIWIVWKLSELKPARQKSYTNDTGDTLSGLGEQIAGRRGRASPR